MFTPLVCISILLVCIAVLLLIDALRLHPASAKANIIAAAFGTAAAIVPLLLGGF